MISTAVVDGVAIVRLDHGLNAFDGDLLGELDAALDGVEADGSVVGLVTTGTAKHYSNGYDVGHLTSGPDPAGFLQASLELLARVLTFPVPTAAALNGHAFGFGALLALAHDQRVARADRGWFCLPEVDLSMRLHPFHQAIVTARLSPETAAEAVLTGRRYDGAAGVAAGIVHQVVTEDALVDTAAARVTAWAGKPRHHLQAMKRDLHRDLIALL